MIGTLIFGSAFLGIKAVEWTADYHEGLIPHFSWDATGQHWPTSHHAREAGKVAGPTPEGYVWDFKHGRAVNIDQVKMYFMLYFCMTGLHAIHMVAGAIILFIMLIMAINDWFTRGNDQPVEIFGLYWHFVDIVWVFLFPLLYLIAGFHPGGH
jgi:cytochrome c oxidase subunit 3